jgi:L-threonylcarbamoyladenylate synthase
MVKKRVTKDIIKILKKGGVGVLATDTIYGVVGPALNKKTVKRLYKIRGRDPKKPFIILIGTINDLKKFGVKITPEFKKAFKRYWPGKVSIILPCTARKFNYLHRGKKSLAFRLPAKKNLRELIKKTGPLVAPSANPEKKKPAARIQEAKNYFGDKIDFYIDAGKIDSVASTVIEIRKGKIFVIRAARKTK